MPGLTHYCRARSVEGALFLCSVSLSPLSLCHSLSLSFALSSVMTVFRPAGCVLKHKQTIGALRLALAAQCGPGRLGTRELLSPLRSLSARTARQHGPVPPSKRPGTSSCCCLVDRLVVREHVIYSDPSIWLGWRV